MSDDTDSTHRTPLSSSSSTPSGTSALSVTIEAAPGEAAAPAETEIATAPADASPAPIEDVAPLAGEPAEPVVAGAAETADPTPPTVDAEAPLEGEPSDPVVATGAESEARASYERLSEYVEAAASEPVAEFVAETIVEPAEEVHAEPVAEQLAESHEWAEDIAPEGTGAAPAEIAAAPEPEPEPEVTRLVAVPNEPDPALTERLRAAVRETIAQNEAKQDRAYQVFGQASAHLKVALDEAGHDAARITFKLMEFAQANVRSNLEFAREYAAVRSVPDIFDLQAAYFKRQMALMNAQAEEFRKLTAEITSKSAAPFKSEIKVLTGR
ncbi:MULTISPECIES: phasin family protein [Rhodomicrobium]|uniref:phasin family protein n=1 Tax=Rhodomicrobium TaxID=1068 RepID=UPI000B4BD5DF|nr:MULTISPECIES: phasin family protein [Rhodomicrobium]